MSLVEFAEMLSSTRRMGRAVSDGKAALSDDWGLVGDAVPFNLEGVGGLVSRGLSYRGTVCPGVKLVEVPLKYECPRDMSICPFGCGIKGGTIKFTYSK